jgi:hypothetical protein
MKPAEYQAMWTALGRLREAAGSIRNFTEREACEITLGNLEGELHRCRDEHRYPDRRWADRLMVVGVQILATCQLQRHDPGGDLTQ